MAFDMSNYVDVAERIRLAMEKWPDATFQNVETKVVEINGRYFVSATVELYRDPTDLRPARATAWEPIPGSTPYTRDSEMMNAETSAMGRAVIAAGIPSKKVASAEEIRNRQHAPQQSTPRAEVETQIDPWTGEAVELSPAVRVVNTVPQCAHGPMKYWESSKTGTVLYFCSLDKNHPDVCEAVKG